MSGVFGENRDANGLDADAIVGSQLAGVVQDRTSASTRLMSKLSVPDLACAASSPDFPAVALQVDLSRVGGEPHVHPARSHQHRFSPHFRMLNLQVFLDLVIQFDLAAILLVLVCGTDPALGKVDQHAGHGRINAAGDDDRLLPGRERRFPASIPHRRSTQGSCVVRHRTVAPSGKTEKDLASIQAFCSEDGRGAGRLASGSGVDADHEERAG